MPEDGPAAAARGEQQGRPTIFVLREQLVQNLVGEFVCSGYFISPFFFNSVHSDESPG